MKITENLLDDLAQCAWDVLNFDNDPKRDEASKWNWDQLRQRMRRVLEGKEKNLTKRTRFPFNKPK